MCFKWVGIPHNFHLTGFLWEIFLSIKNAKPFFKEKITWPIFFVETCDLRYKNHGAVSALLSKSDDFMPTGRNLTDSFNQDIYQAGSVLRYQTKQR